MKYGWMYLILIYVTFCADDVSKHDHPHSLTQRIIRALVWPVTVTNWFRIQNTRLFRMMHIVWLMLTTGWFLSLVQDKFF